MLLHPYARREKPPFRNRNQLGLEFGEDEIAGDIASFHRRWDMDAEREKINRSRFAQRALKPADVRQELEITDAVLGDPDAVREFVLTAAQRLSLSIVPDKRPNVFRVAVGPNVIAALPAAVSFVLPRRRSASGLSVSIRPPRRVPSTLAAITGSWPP